MREVQLVIVIGCIGLLVSFGIGRFRDEYWVSAIEEIAIRQAREAAYKASQEGRDVVDPVVVKFDPLPSVWEL
jgi:hypothetical protein